MTMRAALVHEEFPGDLPREHRQRELRDPAGVLRPFARADVGRRHATHAGGVDGRGQFLGARARAALLLAEVQADIAREFHFAIGQQLAAEIRHGAEHARKSEDARQQFVLEHAVLHRERIVEPQVPERLERLRRVDGLGGDDQRAGVAAACADRR